MSIFIENKYAKWYFDVITFAQQRTEILEYFEKHHIIPKSLGGSNREDNLVKLTAREHFVCHWLLTKMVSNTKHRYQMWNAFSCMLYRNNPNQKRHKVNSKMFENIKKEGAKIKSLNFSGKNNPMYGKTHSQEARLKIKNAHFGKKRSEEACKNISNAQIGKPKSESHKDSLKQSWEKNRKNRSGKNSSWFGREHTDETKEKIRQQILNMPLYTCEHCEKSTTKGNYKRWHGDRCKLFQGELKFLA